MTDKGPIVVELPTVERPPIYIDAGPAAPVVAPGLSGGRGMFKRLIVACDGTWLNSDNGMITGRISVPSNVTRLSRAIKTVSQDGIPQIVNYQMGVGAQGNLVGRVVGGATGEGLADTIREAYSFLANNYHPGDEIFLFGFSRGAFTARSIAGLISEVGLLTKKGLHALPEVFADVQNRRNPNYVPKNPNQPFPNKPSANSPRYSRELEHRGLTRLDIPIKVVGVWDTVGSLGAPRIGWLTKVGLQSHESKEMCFYDTKLSNCIENAFQALALDEKRHSFAPAVWEKPEGNRTTLRQVWFPGVHSNVGGGIDDQQLANISLAWMMDQVEPFLDIRDEYLFEQDVENERYYRRDGQSVRPWSFGEIENSSTGIYALGGSKLRTPGLNHATDPHTLRPLARPLRNTHEYIHPSVRTRLRFNGPGIADKSVYDCPALTEDYKLVVDYEQVKTDDDTPDVYWKLRWRDETGESRILPEAPLWRLERELCKRDPKMWEEVRRPAPTGRNGVGRRRERDRVRDGERVHGERDRDRDRDARRRPRSASYVPPPEYRGSRRSFMQDPRQSVPGSARGSRVLGEEKDIDEERRRRRRRSMSRVSGVSRGTIVSEDRVTDIRESMPHRRPKEKTWWDGEEEDPGVRRRSENLIYRRS
ncbi:hypothetical protein M011DRAFT_401163 [Sporormia fimetaria CBS 119925]|uniref:T6SS Phospholipase effector Tle1-like catalytic domain-containing protein n=1 Tax=Sporormia fimetaria CBS 119925 TaxID=1340428 RepID=A0A6A6VE11_9PLEO|nr:hypothetical protein M011DRAFT_401163 [Sporormia fimetaria CBS 119925]